MALINCPECEKMISDSVEACPNCGYPIKNTIEIEKTDIQRKKIDANPTQNLSNLSTINKADNIKSNIQEGKKGETSYYTNNFLENTNSRSQEIASKNQRNNKEKNNYTKILIGCMASIIIILIIILAASLSNNKNTANSSSSDTGKNDYTVLTQYNILEYLNIEYSGEQLGAEETLAGTGIYKTPFLVTFESSPKNGYYYEDVCIVIEFDTFENNHKSMTLYTDGSGRGSTRETFNYSKMFSPSLNVDKMVVDPEIVSVKGKVYKSNPYD